MGIKNLSKLITKFSPRGKRPCGYSELSGKRVAVDVSIFMYKFCFQTSGEPHPLFVRQLDTFRTYNWYPIYVFDGTPSGTKSATLEKRRSQKKKDHENMETAQQEFQQLQKNGGASIGELSHASNRVERYSKRVRGIPTGAHYGALWKYLQSQNIPCEKAPHDAEKHCAHLVSTGTADAVLTEDFDVIPYLCGLAQGRGMMLTGYGAQLMTMYDVPVILEDLGLSHAQMIDLCILSGCDHCSKLYGIACFKAYKLVQDNTCIENIIEIVDPSKVPENFAYEEARAEFTSVEQ